MNNDRRFKPAVLAIVVLLAAAAAVTSGSAAEPPRSGLAGPRNPAPAAAPDPAAPVPGGPAFLMVNPFQFRPAFPDCGLEFSDGELDNPGPRDCFYEAALTLPNNIAITKMVVYFYDNSEKELLVGLWRVDPSTGDQLQMATVASVDAQDLHRNAADTSILSPLVDQQSYSYIIEVGMPAGSFNALRLAAVRIDYAYEVSLPSVVKNP